MVKKLLLLSLTVLLISCLDQKALIQKLTPKEDDALARHFIELVRIGDYDAAEKLLDLEVKGPESTKGLLSLHEILAQGEPESIELIGCSVVENWNASRKVNLAYQIHYTNDWVVGDVLIHSKNIFASHFQKLPESLETMNRFSLWNKSPVHYAFLAACIFIPAFILFTLVVCIRSRIRRKWLWIIFILFGVVQINLSWTSGHMNFQPISVLLFGASFFRVGMYGPWILGCALPLGAVIFLILRRKLLLPPAPPQETQS